MKKILLAVAATLALTASALGADRAPAFNWTGCYAGGNIGGGWSNSKSVTGGVGAINSDGTSDGIVGGVQTGCDYQFSNNWLVGVQGMWDWSGIDGKANATNFPTDTLATRIHGAGSLTARLGYVVAPSVLVYGKWGFGAVRNQFTYDCGGAGLCAAGNVARGTGTVDGPVYGAGLSWMIAPQWEVFVDYEHFDLRNRSYHVDNGSPGVSFSVDQRQDLDKVVLGLNYRFGSR